MPTYDYKCKNCDFEFEEFQPMSADSLTMCPRCKTPNLVRAIGTGAGMIFKGSGFYLTDYGKANSDMRESKSKPKPNATPPAEKKPPEAKPSSDTKSEPTPPPSKQ